jgi:DNA-binding CsgD family transcriptional regulator
VEHELGEVLAGDAYLEQLVERYRDPDTPPIIDFILCATAVFPTVARINGTARWLDLAQQAGGTLLARDFTVYDADRTLGLVAVERGDAGEARRLHDELVRVQQDYRGWFARSAGLMALTAGDIETALAHFDESYTFTRNAGYRPEHAWCCCDQADALLARGADKDAERAQLVLEEGRGIARELGMKPLEARIASRLDKLCPGLPALYPDGLTAREVEVLRLVAQGLTNKEIAYELSISTNTVATHLKHLLEKTRVANRAEATAYALRRGLTSSEEPQER